jgi:hypothetical protein
MSHKFVILRNGVLETYTKYEDIPESFDNMIEFAPEIPPGPHDHDDHEEIDSWNDKLKDLMRRETR